MFVVQIFQEENKTRKNHGVKRVVPIMAQQSETLPEVTGFVLADG